MYAESHSPCCASTAWQEMNQGVLRGMLENVCAVCTRCKVIAKSVRADSTFAQVCQGQQILGGRLVGGRAEQDDDGRAQRGRCATFGARHACPCPRPGPAAPALSAFSHWRIASQQCRDGVPGGQNSKFFLTRVVCSDTSLYVSYRVENLTVQLTIGSAGSFSHLTTE